MTDSLTDQDFTGGSATTTIPRVDGQDLADDTFLAVAPAIVAPVVRDPASWRQWWPDLRLTVSLDRGRRGLHWSVAGALSGSAEIWLEPVGDGTVLHFYLRAGLSDEQRAARALGWKRCVHALKDALEGDRAAGTAARRSR